MKINKSIGLIYYVFLAAFLYLPIILLLIFSFNDSTLLTFPLKGFTIKWYQSIFQTPELIAAIKNTVIVATTSSLISTMLGAMLAIAVNRFSFKGRKLIANLATYPMVIPYLVLGVALLLLFNALRIPLSLLTVIIGHIVINIPYTMLIVGARLTDFPDHLEEASMDLGATYWETLANITLPIIFPSLLSAFLSSFTTSFDEFALTFFLSGTQNTLPIYIYSQLRFPSRLPLAITVATLIIVVSSFLLILSEWLQTVGEKRKARNI